MQRAAQLRGAQDRARIVDNLLARISQGNVELFKQIVTNQIISPASSFADHLVESWNNAISLNTVDLKSTIEGFDLLIDNGYLIHDLPFFADAPVGSKYHQLTLHLIKRGIIDRELMNGVIPDLNAPIRSALTSQIATANIRRNIPGAAAAATAKRILKNKLNMNRRGPVNIIGQMMGAPATVGRARKTRRNK